MKNIKLIEDKIAFKFLEDTDGNGFSSTTEAGLIVQRQDDKQVNVPRWGVALKCADAVTEIKEGEYILIEPLGWTTSLELSEVYDEKFWVTTESKVMAVSDEEPKLL